MDCEGVVSVGVKTRVIVVDDDTFVRATLSKMLGALGIEVVGQGDDGDQVPELVQTLKPDVVIMDLRMQRVDGVEATRRLQRMADPPGVLAITSFDTDAAILDAINAGVSGFLAKDEGPEEIASAVTAVALGGCPLSPRAAKVVVRQARNSSDGPVQLADSLAALTDREIEVALAVTEGLPNSRIADRIFMSEATVKSHVSSAITKLGLENRVQLAVTMTKAKFAGQLP